MTTRILIKHNNIDDISFFLETQFGFTSNPIDRKMMVLQKQLMIEIIDNKIINDFAVDFLKENRLDDSNFFYSIIGLKDYNLEINIYYVNKLFEHTNYKNYIILLFSKLSEQMEIDLIININEIDYLFLQKGKLKLKFSDYR